MFRLVDWIFSCTVLNSFFFNSCTAREFLYQKCQTRCFRPLQAWLEQSGTFKSDESDGGQCMSSASVRAYGWCAAQVPVPEWRVASAQKLSWAALRGSAGFPGTHACARTWPTACGDSSSRLHRFFTSYLSASAQSNPTGRPGFPTAAVLRCAHTYPAEGHHHRREHTGMHWRQHGRVSR